MRKLVVLIALLITAISNVDSALAAKPYRCDGKVQFRPCDFKFMGREGGSMVRLDVSPEQLERITGLRRDVLHKDMGRSGEIRASLGPIQVAPPPAKFAPLRSTAEILKPRLKHLPQARGLWEGIVKGMGEITLNLLIFRKGQLESTRFMGRVILDRPKSTTFAFNGPLPKGHDWEWTIVADGRAMQG